MRRAYVIVIVDMWRAWTRGSDISDSSCRTTKQRVAGTCEGRHNSSIAYLIEVQAASSGTCVYRRSISSGYPSGSASIRGTAQLPELPPAMWLHVCT
jgi:hypothetical protein